jgi:hypothetical protein
MQGLYRRVAYAGVALALPCMSLAIISRVSTTAAASASPARTITVSTVRFGDGFEGNHFAAWTVHTGVGGRAFIENRVVKSGRYAAQFSAVATKGSYAYARKQLSPGQQSVIVSGDFRVLDEGARKSNVPLFRLFNAAGARMISVYRQNHFHNQVWIQYNNAYRPTRGKLPLNTWAHLEVRVTPAGSSESAIEIRLNKALIYSASMVRRGNADVRAVQIGDEARRQRFTLVADNIDIRAFKRMAVKVR